MPKSVLDSVSATYQKLMLVSAVFSFNVDGVTFGKTSKFIVGVIKIKGLAFAAQACDCTKKHPNSIQKTNENCPEIIIKAL